MLDTIVQSLPVIIFVVTVLLAARKYFAPRSAGNLPPGPKPKFLLGNLRMLSRYQRGQARIDAIGNLVHEYGDHGVCTVYLGSQPWIFVTDYDTIKSILHDDVYTGRPHGMRDVLFERKGLLFTDGELWREQRRFALSTLRDLGMGKNWLQELMLEEARALIDDLTATAGQPIDPSPLLTTSIANVICGIAFGKRFDHRDARFVRLTTLFGQSVQLMDKNGLLDYLPLLRRVPFGPFRRRFEQLLRNFHDVQRFMGELVSEHEVHYQAGDKTDYIDAFMSEQVKQKGDPNTTFTDAQLRYSIANLFAAGTETTSTTISWAIVYLMNNPHVYEKVQQEVDAWIPDGCLPKLEDKDELPYLQATIMEVQRMANLVPVPGRCTMEATILNGYAIPAHTPIVPFLPAVHYDERFFPEPYIFKPERYLTEGGSIKMIEGFMPFSVGKRYCIGESLAKMELYIFFATLLKYFSLTLPDNESLSPANSTYGIVHSPQPYQIIFTPR